MPLKDQSLFIQKFSQLRLEDFTAPADFFGLDFAGCDVFQIGWPGYFKIIGGFSCCENGNLTVVIGGRGSRAASRAPATRIGGAGSGHRCDRLSGYNRVDV